jgi:glycosyltransferase involved in cell wall biosynthesis
MTLDQRAGNEGAGKLAVLLATYNGARFLDAQLRSVVSQDWPAIDVIASDDSSTDNTLELLASWRAIWNKGAFTIASGPRRGFAGNFRRLLAEFDVDADYVAFCDQDDIWLSDKTRVAIAAIDEHGSRPALYCARTLVTDVDDRPVSFSTLFRKTPDFANALVQSIGGGNTMVMNRAAYDLLREAARRTDFVSHDWFAYLIVAGAGGKVIYSETPHVRYRQHGANLIGSNLGFRARISRARFALSGRYVGWNNLNMSALAACRDLLTPDAVAKFDHFRKARHGHMPSRLLNLWRSGVYRQTAIGQVSLYLAGLLGKL